MDGPKIQNLRRITGPQEYFKTTSKDKITYFKCWKENMCEKRGKSGQKRRIDRIGYDYFEGVFLLLQTTCLFTKYFINFQITMNRYFINISLPLRCMRLRMTLEKVFQPIVRSLQKSLLQTDLVPFTFFWPRQNSNVHRARLQTLCQVLYWN